MDIVTIVLKIRFEEGTTEVGKMESVRGAIQTALEEMIDADGGEIVSINIEER